MRLTSEQLEQLKKDENVNTLWSWSRWNTFQTSSYEYYLRYIKHEKEDRRDSIYGSCGSLVHESLEDFYNHKITYEQMAERFDESWMISTDIMNLKFDRSDEEKNTSIGDKYFKNLNHFFKHHIQIRDKMETEEFIKIRVGDAVFQGYLDGIVYHKDGSITILDWKTSSMFKEDKYGQLVLYGLGKIQEGYDISQIKLKYNMLKYITVSYIQKNGKEKVRNIERYKIGESLQTVAKMFLKMEGYTDVDHYLMDMIDENGIDCLPDEVKAHFIISDCYVEIPFTQELIDKWCDKIEKGIKDIELREHDYEDMKKRGMSEAESSKVWWESDEQVEKESYYFSNLCGYSADKHKPYAAYLDRLNQKKQGMDFFSGVGGNTNNTISSSSVSVEEDLSWLNDL